LDAALAFWANIFLELRSDAGGDLLWEMEMRNDGDILLQFRRQTGPLL
jgi:hypothetical protein